MHLGHRAIELERFAAGFVAHRLSLLGADTNAVAGSDVVGIGEPGVSKGVVGIGGNGLLKQIDTFLQALGRASVPELAAFEIEPVSLWIGRSSLPELLLLSAADLNLQAGGEIASDLSLHLSNVG